MIIKKSSTLIKKARNTSVLTKTTSGIYPFQSRFFKPFTDTNNNRYDNPFKSSYQNQYGRNNYGQQPQYNNRNQNQNVNPSFDNQNTGIYTSKYYEINTQEILGFLAQHRIEYKMRNNEIVLVYCPLCDKPHHNDPSNLNTCNIEQRKGFFNCFRCMKKGSWFDFKNAIVQKFYGKSFGEMISSPNRTTMEEGNQFQEDVRLNHQKYDLLSAHNYFLQMKKDIYPEINRYLTTTEEPDFRGLRKETLEKFRVGVGKEKFRNDYEQLSWFDCVFFPLYSPRSKKQRERALKGRSSSDENESNDPEKTMNTDDFEVVKMKLRAVGKENKSKQRFLPVGSELKGLFGLTTVKESDKAIVITEGEFDAMAVHQETGMPAVSLPNGASHLPVQFLPFFEKFERIYLWMDADEVGRSSAEKFAQKLGMKRTIIIDSRLKDKNGPKDANDALKAKISFIKIFSECSKTLGDQNLLTFSQIKDKVLNRILNFEEISGIQSKSFTFYNRTLKGFRKGELSLVTGATGSGKTTFLSQLSLDFLTQGIPTLWGSFEIKNEILAQTMLSQYSKKKVTDKENAEKLPFIIEQFEQHPLYFMNFYGSTPIDLLFETLDYAIYTYDIQFICIDNMQFMLSQQAVGTSKFELQDRVANMLRTLATEKNVHISVIIHPKKVEDDNNLNVGSIFGTAKITQEADSVMILQKSNMPNYRILQLKKNRFDGEVGEVSMIFNTENKRYIEITTEEKQILLTTGGNFNSILKSRMQKYGTLEPQLEQIELQLKEKEAADREKKKLKKNKNKEMTEQDLEFYKSQIDVKEEPEETQISGKNRFYYYSSGSEKAINVEDEENGKTLSYEFNEELFLTDILGNDYSAIDQPLDDLSITDQDLEKMYKNQKALTTQEIKAIQEESQKKDEEAKVDILKSEVQSESNKIEISSNKTDPVGEKPQQENKGEDKETIKQQENIKNLIEELKTQPLDSAPQAHPKRYFNEVKQNQYSNYQQRQQKPEEPKFEYEFPQRYTQQPDSAQSRIFEQIYAYLKPQWASEIKQKQSFWEDTPYKQAAPQSGKQSFRNADYIDVDDEMDVLIGNGDTDYEQDVDNDTIKSGKQSKMSDDELKKSIKDILKKIK